MPISDSFNWEFVCSFRTPIERLDNTSEVEVPLQKIGDQAEVFPYKKQNKTEIQLTVKKSRKTPTQNNCTCDTISTALELPLLTPVGNFGTGISGWCVLALLSLPDTLITFIQFTIMTQSSHCWQSNLFLFMQMLFRQ